ncbi:DinB family protein [Candidatus Bathyarchaeota archaeon]|nr:DinB family protein [Candidatus Bathyarchaeota archaeon]
MNEVKFLRDQIETTFKGDSWHGPSLMKTLEGVDLEQAKARPLGERHTIWELVDHTTFWLEASLNALKGIEMPEPEMKVNWPKMGRTEEQWSQSVQRLEAAVNMVLDELAGWSSEGLERTVPGKDYNFRQLLHGAMHHNLYHAGQIALLKRKMG